MNTSESIKEIATALSAAQGSLQDATKNAKIRTSKATMPT